MKAKDNLKTENMKTKLKILLAETLVALLILVGTVNASEVLNKVNLESNLQLEEWMTDENIWNTSSINMAEFAEEMDEELTIEEWMTDSMVWVSNYMIETEASLELESWMTDSIVWVSNFIVENESSMELESWMTDENVWENHVELVEANLTVEAWMIGDEYWQ